MARPEKCRRVNAPPLMRGFRPFGIPVNNIGRLSLTYEEYESLRLVSYEMNSHNEAANVMNVSRPTLTRIYNRAIKNISKAFIEGMSIIIEGGSYEFDEEWYRCRRCHKLINGIDNHFKCNACDYFNDNELVKLNI